MLFTRDHLTKLRSSTPRTTVKINNDTVSITSKSCVVIPRCLLLLMTQSSYDTVASFEVGFTISQISMWATSQVILVSIKEFCVAGRKSLVSMNNNI